MFEQLFPWLDQSLTKIQSDIIELQSMPDGPRKSGLITQALKDQQMVDIWFNQLQVKFPLDARVIAASVRIQLIHTDLNALRAQDHLNKLDNSNQRPGTPIPTLVRCESSPSRTRIRPDYLGVRQSSTIKKKSDHSAQLVSELKKLTLKN